MDEGVRRAGEVVKKAIAIGDRESQEQIRQRAAAAYAKYQKIGTTSAQRLFASGW